MNILQVTPYFAPSWAYGGPPRVVYSLSRELVRRGHSVTVLTTDAFDSVGRFSSPSEIKDGIEIHRLRNISNRLAWRQQLFLPRGILRFVRDHLRRFDVVHVHMFRTFANVIVDLFAEAYDIPYVLSAHGSLPRIVRLELAKAVFDRLAGKRLLQNAERLIALSNMEKLQYQACGVPSTKVSIVPNGIEISEFERLPVKGDFARARGLEGKRLVLYVGRLNSRKGLTFLVRAFREISVKAQDAVLVLVGPDDGDRMHLQRAVEQMSISDRVVFTGFVSEAEKRSALVDAHVVVYPALHEVFGLVPFEALICGQPVVVTHGSGCGEILEKAGIKFTVPPADVTALREAIFACLGDGPDIREMVRRGQELVLEQLTWDRIGLEVETVYHQVARR